LFSFSLLNEVHVFENVMQQQAPMLLRLFNYFSVTGVWHLCPRARIELSSLCTHCWSSYQGQGPLIAEGIPKDIRHPTFHDISCHLATDTTRQQKKRRTSTKRTNERTNERTDERTNGRRRCRCVVVVDVVVVVVNVHSNIQAAVIHRCCVAVVYFWFLAFLDVDFSFFVFFCFVF